MTHEKLKKLEENFDKYKKTLALVYADGDVTPAERNRLNSLKNELGLSDSDCMSMEAYFHEIADRDGITWEDLKEHHHCSLCGSNGALKWKGINYSMVEYLEIGDTYIEASNGDSYTGLREPFVLSIGQSFKDLLDEYGEKHIYDAIEDRKLEVFEEQNDLETYLKLRFDVRDEKQVLSDYQQIMESPFRVTEENTAKEKEFYLPVDIEYKMNIPIEVFDYLRSKGLNTFDEVLQKIDSVFVKESTLVDDKVRTFFEKIEYDVKLRHDFAVTSNTDYENFPYEEAKEKLPSLVGPALNMIIPDELKAQGKKITFEKIEASVPSVFYIDNNRDRIDVTPEHYAYFLQSDEEFKNSLNLELLVKLRSTAYDELAYFRQAKAKFNQILENNPLLKKHLELQIEKSKDSEKDIMKENAVRGTDEAAGTRNDKEIINEFIRKIKGEISPSGRKNVEEIFLSSRKALSSFSSEEKEVIGKYLADNGIEDEKIISENESFFKNPIATFEHNNIEMYFDEKEIEDENMNNETLADKYNRMEKFFEGKYCNDFRKGDSFAQLYESVKKEFPNKTFPSWTDEKVLENAVSRIIYENIDFNLFSPDNYDVVYDVTDGYDQRCEISDKLAELLITNNIKFKDFNSLKDFLPNIEKPLLKEIKDNNPDMQVIDRINSAFNVASRLYPGIESAGNKKAYIEKAFDSLKTDYEEKILNNELEFFELEALVKGLDAVRDGEKSLSYIRPNAEEMQIGSEEGWKFDEFTKGYALFQNSDSTLKGGVTPKFISKIDDMGVFESDGDAAVQWEKDTHGKLIQERESMWIGDEDLEYYSYPDTPENRAILKENGWLLEHPLKFDFSEFTENDFYKIKNELLKDRPNEDYYGRLHIGSIHVEFVINQSDGWVDTNYYILGEKGEGEAQFGVPYNYFPGKQFIANLFTENTYEEFKEKVSKAVLEDIATVGILKTEAMRPLVDWSDEKQCKELYRTKLVESARENEIVIAPYSQDRCDMEAVRSFIASIDGEPAGAIQDDVVMAVIDNIGKVQDSKEGDFLKLRKDGTMEHISALGHVEKEPLEILSIINSFAENHAAVSEEHSQQRKDYEKINSLYKKAYEKHMRINDNGFNPSEYVLNKLKEKGIEVITDKEEFDRILLRENNLQKMSEKLTEEQWRRYFTFDEEDTKKFEEHVNEWQKDNTNPSKLIVVGKITPVMKILGISEKLIEVEQSTLDKMTRYVPVYPNDKQGHKLSVYDIYAIPSQLADPVMVFKSRTRNDSFVFFTERKDSGNHSILIPLAVEKRKGRIVIHEITSMYGKDNEIVFVKTNIDENNLVYEDRKRSCLWAKEKIEELENQNIKDDEKNKSSNGGRFTQIQFLGQRFTDNGTYTFNILTKERLVNFISSQNPKINPVQNMVLSDGITYGFTYEGKIYLNSDVLGAESAVHEYTHLWDNLTRKDNPELWNKGLKIFKGTSLWNEVINDSHYQDIKDDENLVLSECHARICGRVADSVLNHIAELDGNEKQAEMIDWDKETIDFIFENYRDIFAGSSFNSVAEFTASAMKNLFSPLAEIKKETPNIETLSFIKEVLEKESGIRVDEKIAGEIYSRYQDHDLNLELEYYPNGTFRAYDHEGGKYTNPFKIGDAVEQVLSWNEKELSELHAGTADDKEIEEIKKINGELERICGQIACNGRLEVLDSADEKSVGKVKKFFEDDGFKVERSEAKTLLAFASDFHDGTSEYAVNDNNQLYFRTSNDNEGWSFISENDHEYGYEIIANAFEHALNLLDASQKDHVQALRSFVQKNREILSDDSHSYSQGGSVKEFMQKLESLEMPEERITVTHSVTFPCGFIFPKEIYENDPGEIKREEYRWKIYEKIKEKFGFHDNDTETEYFKGNIPSGSSFNIHFAVSVPDNIKTDAEKVDAWIKDVEEFVKEECGCTFINWTGGERLETVYESRKQYRMEEERIKYFAQPNTEALHLAKTEEIIDYCKISGGIDLAEYQAVEVYNFYHKNISYELAASPVGNLYIHDFYNGKTVPADAELLFAGHNLRSASDHGAAKTLDYLMEAFDGIGADNGLRFKELLSQISDDKKKRLDLLSEVLADSFETLDRHDEFWKALLDYGANPAGAVRIAAEDANLGDNLNWLLDNIPEFRVKEIFSDKAYAEEVYDSAKKSVAHDIGSWTAESDIGFAGFKRIAVLCGQEKDADRFYGECLEKCLGKPVEPNICQLLDTPELLAEKMNARRLYGNAPEISLEQAMAILDYCSYEYIRFYCGRNGEIYSLDVSENYNGEGLREDNFGILANGMEYADKAKAYGYKCYTEDSYRNIKELWDSECAVRHPENPEKRDLNKHSAIVPGASEKESSANSLKVPVEIIREIAFEKEKEEVPGLFKNEFRSRIKSRHATKDPFIIAKAILNEWKNSRSEYIPILNEWLFKNGCTSKERFENFFRSLGAAGEREVQKKDDSRLRER